MALAARTSLISGLTAARPVASRAARQQQARRVAPVRASADDERSPSSPSGTFFYKGKSYTEAEVGGSQTRLGWRDARFLWCGWLFCGVAPARRRRSRGHQTLHMPTLPHLPHTPRPPLPPNLAVEGGRGQRHREPGGCHPLL